MNLVFANQNKEDAIYPLTTREIAEAQQQDNNLKTQAEKEGCFTPHSWSKISKNSVTREKWLYQKAYNTMQELGFTTTCNIQGPSVSKKLFVF